MVRQNLNHPVTLLYIIEHIIFGMHSNNLKCLEKQVDLQKY